MPAWADEAAWQAIAGRIGQAPLLRGEFEQDKQVAGFRNALRSRGDFVLARGHGVIWNTRAPFPLQVVVTSERILSRQPDGRVKIELDGSRQPALAAVNAMLLALVSGDVQALSVHFDANAVLEPGVAWRMRLVPRSASLSKVFVEIKMSGDQHVREVEIAETGGDRTRLRFIGFKTVPAQLTRDEAALFD